MSAARMIHSDSPMSRRPAHQNKHHLQSNLGQSMPAIGLVTPEQTSKNPPFNLHAELMRHHNHLVIPEDLMSRSALHAHQHGVLTPRIVHKPVARPQHESTTATPPCNHSRIEVSHGQDPAPCPPTRLNKFVRRLYDMLKGEQESGIVEWRRGLLVLHSTDAFAHAVLPKYFKTRNFKTFRRQLNYYGFVHVRSFSTTGSATTALWVNRSLAQKGSDDISSVLMLKRVDPCETTKTAEGRRQRKEEAIHTVEEDIGVSPKSLQLEQIRALAMKGHAQLASHDNHSTLPYASHDEHIPQTYACLPTMRKVSNASAAHSSSSETSMEDDHDSHHGLHHDSHHITSDDESVVAASVLLMLSQA